MGQLQQQMFIAYKELPKSERPDTNYKERLLPVKPSVSYPQEYPPWEKLLSQIYRPEIVISFFYFRSFTLSKICCFQHCYDSYIIQQLRYFMVTDNWDSNSLARTRLRASDIVSSKWHLLSSTIPFMEGDWQRVICIAHLILHSPGPSTCLFCSICWFSDKGIWFCFTLNSQKWKVIETSVNSPSAEIPSPQVCGLKNTIQ